MTALGVCVAQSPKSIAITIDDLLLATVADATIEESLRVNEQQLAALVKHGISIVGFVDEDKR